MKTVRQIHGMLTFEDEQAITERDRRILLYSLLSEIGYDVLKMQKLMYTSGELRKRLVAAIRNQKIELANKEKQLQALTKKQSKQFDLFFEALKKLQDQK